MTGREKILARAKGYPYPRHPRSFVYTDEGILDAVPEPPPGSTPVLAYGSNPAPEQLARKFGGRPGAVSIPTCRVELRDFDVVYAPLFAYYGSLPATIVPSPGTVVDTWVQYLDADLLETMHESEGLGSIYAFEPLPAGAVDVEGCFAYRALDGALRVGDGPAALAAVPARMRLFPELTEVEALRHAMEWLGVEGDLDDFILEIVADRRLRGERGAALPRVRAG